MSAWEIKMEGEGWRTPIIRTAEGYRIAQLAAMVDGRTPPELTHNEQVRKIARLIRSCPELVEIARDVERVMLAAPLASRLEVPAAGLLAKVRDVLERIDNGLPSRGAAQGEG